MLELKNIRKTYKTSKGVVTEALKGINLEFPDHGMIFVLGKSGSGKSTLLNVIGGLDRPDSGEIIMMNKSSSSFSDADYDSYRNTYLGFIFQDFQLIETYSIYRNIALALQLQQQTQEQKQIDEILKKVGLEGYGSRYPSELSGGQKQRVAIARALVKKPRILMADEPTGALDSDTGKEIFELLKEVSKEQLVIVVSHDRDSAKTYANRIIELKDGEVLQDESFVEFQKSEQTFTSIPSHLPLKESFLLGAGCLKHKKLRIIFTIVLTAFALISFGLSDAIGSFKEGNVHKKAMKDNDETYLGIQHQMYLSPTSKSDSIFEPISEAKIKEIEQTTGKTFVREYEYLNRDITKMDLQIAMRNDMTLYDRAATIFYPVEMDDFKELDITDILGRYPANHHEVAITSYLADAIISYGVMDAQGDIRRADNYEDILKQGIQIQVYGAYRTITGIANYDLSEYAKIKEATSHVLDDSLSSTYHKLVKEADLKFNKIFVKTGFMASLQAEENNLMSSQAGFKKLVVNETEHYTEGFAYPLQSVEYYDGNEITSKAELAKHEIILSFQNVVVMGYAQRLEQMRSLNKTPAELQKDYMQYVKNTIGSTMKFQSSRSYSDDALDINQDVTVIGVMMPTEEELLNDIDYTKPSYVSKELIKEYVQPAVFVRELLIHTADSEQAASLIDQYDTTMEYMSHTLYSGDISSIRSIANVMADVFFYVSIAFFLFAAALMTNFIMISITYRKKDIGILRAIGARSKDVLKIFIWEGVIIAVISYIAAMVLMTFLVLYVNSFAMDTIGLLISPIIVTIRQPVAVAFMVTAVSVIACLIPVMRISRQKPIDAIKKQ